MSSGRVRYSEAGARGPGDGFGNEIERMLTERPATRQMGSGGGGGLGAGQGGAPGNPNTLDELMAELGMLRGERGEVSLPGDRQQGARPATRQPRMSVSEAPPPGSSAEGPLRPVTPRTSGTVLGSGGGGGSPASGALTLPPAKGAMPQSLGQGSGGGGGNAPNSPAVGLPPGSLGPVRAQSPMAARRGSMPGSNSGLGSPLTASLVAPAAPPGGVLERQAQLEQRIEKMEAREQQLMALIGQLQQQVSALSRAQQSTQQQVSVLSSTTAAAATASASRPSAGRQATQQPHAVSDEDFIKADNEPSDDERDGREVSPRVARDRGKGRPANGDAPAAPGAAAGLQPQPPGGAGGRPNKLTGSTPAAEWEPEVTQLRKELGALAANVVRMRDHLMQLVPGGPSPLAEEVAAQGAAAGQLKHNLTQIAMDVVSLHKGLSTLRQNVERTHASLEKSVNDVALQAQTNALNAVISAPPGAFSGPPGGGNAVASALAANGGVSGSLEESLRSAFSRPAMRAPPAFSLPPDAAGGQGFMPDNSGVAAAVAAFGGMGGGGGRKAADTGGGGSAAGGLGAAMALLSSFEEQAAAEKEEQQKAAIIAKQALSIVDAKVRQVVLHVDRHMQMVSADVEERLRMYEATIIRMAQQIDRVQKLLRDLEGAASSRIVVRHGPDGAGGGEEARPRTAEVAPEVAAEIEAAAAKANAKDNWLKAAAMANGRFVPQQQEEKKGPGKASPHGYFRAPGTGP